MSNETNATIDEIMQAAGKMAQAEAAYHDMPTVRGMDECIGSHTALRAMIAEALDSHARQIEALTQWQTEIRAEIVECDALRADMASVLRAVAIAVRGPEVDGISWGWADLPGRVTAAVNMMSGAVELAREHAATIESLTAERDELRARLAGIDGQEPVAVIGSGYQMLWTHTGTLLDAVQKHGIKVGSALYISPVPAIPEGWQPIETAPKDGSNVLVCAAGKWSDVSYFYNGHWIALGDQCEETERYPEGVLTHWMPLPSAPDGLHQPEPPDPLATPAPGEWIEWRAEVGRR